MLRTTQWLLNEISRKTRISDQKAMLADCATGGLEGIEAGNPAKRCDLLGGSWVIR